MDKWFPMLSFVDRPKGVYFNLDFKRKMELMIY
jgi:hypothetical protein